MKKLSILIISFALLSSSCQDFLNEDTRSVANQDFYGNEKGLDALVAGCYVTNKIWYAKEEGYDFSEVGTDMYTFAQQHPNPEEFLFSPSFNSTNGRLTVLWVEFYKGVNACNEALFHLQKEDHPMNKDKRAKRQAEVLFLRSHYLWILTELWGNIPMPLKHTTAPVTTATKSTVKEVYEQILTDLNTSVDLFKDTDNMAETDYGRVTRNAVRAFRARINLALGSYIQHAGNPFGFSGSASTYYTQALADSKFLIESNKYSFYTAYSDMWSYANTGAGSINKESIWAINYSRGVYSMINVSPSEYSDYYQPGQKAWDEREGGNHGHLMWGMAYDLFDGMARDLAYGRRFRRFMPNKYLIDLYNESVDARFAGQFRSLWKANGTDTKKYPTWSQFELPPGFTPPGSATDPIFKKDETAIIITKQDIDDNRIAQKTGSKRFLYVDGKHFILDYNLMFNNDGTINKDGTDGRNFFFDLKKFDDPNRTAANGTGSQRGAVDAYVFRLAEMYLIAAEASRELGNGLAYSYMQKLADSRATTGKTGALVLAAYGIISDADITTDKLLDERAREFPGEQLRWFDLKRLHSPAAFIARIRKYNEDARSNMQTHHYLRPIPQVQLDAIENAASFGQNEGY